MVEIGKFFFNTGFLGLRLKKSQWGLDRCDQDLKRKISFLTLPRS